MPTIRIFLWWFVVGALMALAVIMVQGGIREIMQASGPLWDVKLAEVFTAIVGGGLLGGCIRMHPYARKVVSEARLHERARRRVERPAR